MKLLFDQNLSHRLTAALAVEYPGSVHVRAVGMAAATDLVVWKFAAENGFIITSKESDFQQRALLFGHPPKGRLGASWQLHDGGRRDVAPIQAQRPTRL